MVRRRVTRVVAICATLCTVGGGDARADDGAAEVTYSSVTEPVVILVARGTVPRDGFGESVAIDGPYAVVGASQFFHHVTGIISISPNPGYVTMFRHNEGRWSEDSRLEGMNRGERFGAAVAVSGDLVTVGAPWTPGGGAVHVFRRTGTAGWSNEQTPCTVPAPSDGAFGGAVGMDGEYVIVGSVNRQFDGLSCGTRADAFHLSGAEGEPHIALSSADAGNGERRQQKCVGGAVAIDGSYAVVGSPVPPGANGGSGSVAVFRRTGPHSWTEGGSLSPEPAVGTFGTAVAIHGQHIAVGAPIRDGGGRVYVYRRTSVDRWRRVAVLEEPDGFGARAFGVAVAVHEDYLFAGARPLTGGTFGVVYVFRRGEDDTWEPTRALRRPHDSSATLFGSSIAVDARRVIVGAPGGLDGGAAFIWRYR